MSIIIKNGQVNLATGKGVINATQNIRPQYVVRERQKYINIFLSYSWSDDNIANDIYDYLEPKLDVILYRDKIDIGTWKSIKEYMQSIPQMDYVILLISDAYLKSENCMYEVLETMRDRNFVDKIFPIVVSKEIYNPVTRATYVKYWQDKYRELKEILEGIEVQNIGKLGEDLKRRQNIACNIAEFLDIISDINNPEFEEAKIAIEKKIKGIL